MQPATIKVYLQKGKTESRSGWPAGGIIRIQRETKGRKGKTVTAIYGFQSDDTGLKKMASGLKNRCGSGGSVKNGVIVIKGDHRNNVKDKLVKKGYQVKLAGG